MSSWFELVLAATRGRLKRAFCKSSIVIFETEVTSSNPQKVNSLLFVNVYNEFIWAKAHKMSIVFTVFFTVFLLYDSFTVVGKNWGDFYCQKNWHVQEYVPALVMTRVLKTPVEIWKNRPKLSQQSTACPGLNGLARHLNMQRSRVRILHTAAEAAASK